MKKLTRQLHDQSEEPGDIIVGDLRHFKKCRSLKSGDLEQKIGRPLWEALDRAYARVLMAFFDKMCPRSGLGEQFDEDGEYIECNRFCLTTNWCPHYWDDFPDIETWLSLDFSSMYPKGTPSSPQFSLFFGALQIAVCRSVHKVIDLQEIFYKNGALNITRKAVAEGVVQEAITKLDAISNNMTKFLASVIL